MTCKEKAAASIWKAKQISGQWQRVGLTSMISAYNVLQQSSETLPSRLICENVPQEDDSPSHKE